MKKTRLELLIFSVVCISFSFSSSVCAASPPTLFFTDLESGPKTGGENNNGAFVTLYGNNFGTSPTVTVGGGQVIIKLQPSTHLWYQKMTIQLGPNAATGNIIVTTSDGSSNSLPFVVRAGNIYFAGTQSGDQPSIMACKNALASGDICYVRNGLSVAGTENYSAAFILGAQGTLAAPRAMVVYPGAAATIGVSNSSRGTYACTGLSSCPNGSYWVMAGFSLRGVTAVDLVGVSNIRMVGNDFNCLQGAGQTACLHVESTTNSKFFGNYDHGSGSTPTDKFYHRFYFTTNSNHHEIAWNEITGGGANRAIQFFSTGGSDQYGLSVHDNYIHNIVGDGINFATVNAGAGIVEAYNNLIANVGNGPDPSNGASNYACFLIGGTNSGTVEIYNNTMYDCGGRGGNDAGGIAAGVRTRMRNNILHQIGSETYLEPNYGGSNLSGFNNLWYGAGNGPSQTTGNINADPLFISTVTPDYHLQPSSPAIGVGTSISTFLYDIEGYLRATPLDIGAYNFGSATPDTTPPTLPANFNLSASSSSQSSISVSWNPATDNIAVSNYLVERCQGTGCSNFAQVGTPTASPFTDSGLTPNTFYNYHVRATDAAGNLSGWSNVVGATTQAPDTTPPTAPGTLQTSVISSSNITLAWTASTDAIGVTGYKVERCTGASCTNFTEIGTPTATNYSDTGLSAQTLYRYQVRAIDGAGNNSPYSNISSATTPEAPPTPTFISEYETPWNSATSPKTTANFSVQTGDILVAYAVNENSGSTIATPPAGTLSGTWTLKQTINATDYTYLRLWTMNVSTNQTNINVSFSNGSGNWGADVLHFRNASSIGVTAQANSATGSPTLTLNGVSENSSIVMVNGDWSARTGARTYNITQAGPFTETSAYADGSTYGVEAGYYANAGMAGNKTIGITAPTGMKWALAAVEVKGNPSAGTVACNTVTPTNFSQATYNSYGAPFDVFTSNTPLVNVTCATGDTTTINLTTGITSDTTRIVYTKGYWYDAVTLGWKQYSGTCTGALNGDWCQGSVSATITDANVSTASAANPTYLVGMTCSVQGGSWKCGCRDTSCTNFSWQIQGAGL